MIIELVAGRLMSRFIGQSLYTWTAVIGIILAGITLGNLLGGRLADRARALTLFAVVFLGSALAAMLIPYLNSACGHSGLLLGCETRLRIFLHVGLTFLLPAVALGTIGPIAAKLVVESSPATGRALGGVYAWGAAGSIVGTFLTGYYLLSAIGTAATLILAATVLGALGVLFAGLAWSLGRARIVAIGVGVPFGLLALTSLASPGLWQAQATPPDGAPTKTLFSRESPYAMVSVVAREDIPRFRRLYLDRLPHSECDASYPTNLLSGYVWMMEGALAARHGTTDALSLLIIGGGGYSLPRQVAATRPGSRVTVAEIDPVVTEAALKACGLEPTQGLEIRHLDGRQVVQDMIRQQDPAVRFDAIVGDTVEYYSLPYHLATRECAEEIKSLLKPDGMYLLHIVTERKRGSRYLGAILNTLEAVFPQVAVIALKPNPELHTSYLLVGSTVAAGWDRIESCIRAAHPSYSGKRLEDPELASLRTAAAGVVLTDDYAPLEQMVEPVVRADRRDLVISLLDRSREAVKRGDLERAERLNREAVAEDGASADAHFALALLLQQRRDREGALAEVERVLAIDRELFPAQILKGSLLAGRGDVERACREWQAVLALRPKNLDVLRNLAYAREFKGESQGAKAEWESILALQPDDPTAHYALAKLCKREGLPGESEAHAAALRRIDPRLEKIQPNPLPMKSLAQALENLSL